MSVTICFTYFKSLTLANFAAALYSIRRQDLTNVEDLVIVDNDTTDDVAELQRIVDELRFPMPTSMVISHKHHDPTKTHAWSTNVAVAAAKTPWVFFTRADYLLTFDALRAMMDAVAVNSLVPPEFVTGNGCHLAQDISVCEATPWRDVGPQIFSGVEFDYTLIDTGVWLGRRDAFESVGGLDQSLTAWGHAQTHFQWKLAEAGVGFARVPRTLFYHPQHGAPRDLALAHAQLEAVGADLKKMWKRYHGASPY